MKVKTAILQAVKFLRSFIRSLVDRKYVFVVYLYRFVQETKIEVYIDRSEAINRAWQYLNNCKTRLDKIEELNYGDFEANLRLLDSADMAYVVKCRINRKGYK